MLRFKTVPPKVSVIIPTYNRYEHIIDCLDSLKEQTFKDFEVIVVDDGSDEKTRTLIQNFFAKDTYPIPLSILHKKNEGSATARNVGVKLAKGEIIAFIDDDCIADRDWIKNAIEHFEKEFVVAVVGKIDKEVKDTTPTSSVTYTFSPEGFMTASIFYRKSAFLKVGGFDPEFKSFREDTDLGWRISELGKSVFDEDVKVTHKIIDYSVMDFLKKHLKLRETYYDVLLYKKHPKRFKRSNEFVFGISSHMFWPYVMLGPILLFLFSLHWLPSLSGYLGLSVAAIYPWVVFFHTRMRSNISLIHTTEHPIKFLGLLCVWWIAFLWDTVQRMRGMIHYRVLLL